MDKIEEIRLEFIKDKKLDPSLLKDKYLSKKGLLNSLNNHIKTLSNEEKPNFGKKLNELKSEINSFILEKIKEEEERIYLENLKNSKIDLTYPGYSLNKGAVNPLLKVKTELENIFINMGYRVARGPEVELIKYNFDLLNIEKDHPSRDESDTFYIDENLLLRSQTSPVQIREMIKEEGDLKIICPGKVYRKDEDDATHSHQFMQIEVMNVGKNISVSDMKGTLISFLKKIFPSSENIRFRPSFFPFTEPSYEVDVECFKCKGADSDCSLCKGTGFIEVLGCGMVHPKVLENGGYDPKVYSGFAMGMGVERIAMLKYGIHDIRLIYNNNLKYIKEYDRIEGGNLDEII